MRNEYKKNDKTYRKCDFTAWLKDVEIHSDAGNLRMMFTFFY